MRKLFLLILFIAFAGSSFAQGVTFGLVTPPCNNNGILKSYFTGVTPPLTVTWYPYGTSAIPVTHTGVTSLYDILTGYSGGPIMVVASDTTGATDTGNYSGFAPFTYSLSNSPAVCPTLDTASVIITGGTAPFTIEWYNMATLAVVDTGNHATLPPGGYGIILIDATGCTYGSQVDPNYLIVSSTPSFSLVMSETTAGCINGTASTTVTGGGTSPFSYLWSNGATTPSLSALVTNTYDVTVTDALGCIASGSVYVPQSITINAPVTPTAATCLDTNGAVIAFASGGATPYSYLWSNGALTQSQAHLVAGKYIVHVTDANGCIGIDSAQVGTSTPITVTYSSSPSLCTSASGNATIAPTGGTMPYNITWYTSPAQVGVTATHLWAGDYYFHITDAAGCVQSGTAVVPPVDVISLSFTSVAPICTLSNGSMNVFPTGGVAPYSYSWSNGAHTAGISSVPEGDYTITVTDNLGCSVTKTPALISYSPVTVGTLSTDASCIFTNDGINTATPYGGTPPYTYSWSTGGTTATIASLPYGPYWVRASDAAGCTSDWNYSYVDYDHTSASCYCTIEGTVFNDLDSNCVQDAGEPGIPNIQISISGRGYTYTDSAGNYSYKVPAGTYTVSETVLAFYPLSHCQSNAVTVTAGSGASCFNTVNFANNQDTIHDMHISTWDYYPSHPIPGQAYTQATVISNNGTMTESNVLAAYKPDGQLFAPSFIPSIIFTGAPYWYNTDGTFPTAKPGTSTNFFMDYTVPANIPLGTTVVFKDSVAFDTPMTKWLLDYSPWDNINYFTTVVAAPYDPNFKEVYPKGSGSTGLISYTDSVLEYMVHFQNTGTWQAENVMVIDTLDDNLNWTSLRPEYMSAPCKVTLQQQGSKKIATFIFDNINLPPSSSDPMASNGMFTYTVHINSFLPVGSQISNHASIYFDYNSPVMTNATLNTIGTVASGITTIAHPAAYMSFTLYPNPASNTFNSVINCDAAGTAIMSVSDVSGRTVMTKDITLQKGTQTIPTDASQLAPGVYFVTFNQQGKEQTQKLVIMKQ